MTTANKTALEQEWFGERERAAAWLRLAFAVLAIGVVQLNPDRIARFPLLSTLTLGSFLLYSAAALYHVWTNRLASPPFGATITALDITWIALIVFSTGGTRTPFFFYYSFPIITASLRWGLKGSLPVAALGVGIYATIRLTLAAEAGGEPIGIDTIVVRSLYLIVLACIFGYISEFEQKQNKKLMALSRTAAQVSALQERRRIAYELHDGTLQLLATIILRVENCRSQLRNYSERDLNREMDSIEDLTRDSMNQIRRFLAGKESSPLSPGTLLERLKEELRFLQQGLNIAAILETEPDDLDLPHEIERELYYVLREGLTNITRHSNGSRVEIHLRQKTTELKGSLADNGVGMDMTKSASGLGVGLSSMRERVEKLGGGFEIKSSPGHGTKILFSVPMRLEQRLGVNA